MASRFTAVVVGVSEEELADVQWCLSDWDCVAAPLNDQETAVSSIPPAAKLMIVYARKQQKRHPGYLRATPQFPRKFRRTDSTGDRPV